MPLRDKTLWRMLYETAARAEEVLGLDAGDLDMPSKRGRVISKGGSTDWVHWQTGTALLLPRLLAGLILLLGPGADIELNDEDPADVTIYEGRHRITAMRDAGVRRTVIQRSEVTPA